MVLYRPISLKAGIGQHHPTMMDRTTSDEGSVEKSRQRRSRQF